METLEVIGILDIAFIAILIISVLVGLIRGAVREVLSLVGLAVAVYLAFSFSEMVSKEYLSKFFESPKVSYIVSFILIIVASIFTIALVNLFFSQLLRASGLSFINRFFGMVFGLLRGVLICSIITLILNFVPGLTQSSWYKASSTASVFRSIANQALAYLPKEINDYLDSTKKTVGSVAEGVMENAVKERSQQVPKSTPDKGQRVTPQSTPNTQSTPIHLESGNESAPANDGLILESSPEPNTQ